MAEGSDKKTLITHWGLSGPAILKLSAVGALMLASNNYDFNIIINFLGDQSASDFKTSLEQLKNNSPKKMLKNFTQN